MFALLRSRIEDALAKSRVRKCAFPSKPAEPVRYPHPDEDDALSPAQLDLIARTDSSILLSYLEQHTIFDVHRIRLMLALGAVEARRLLAAEPIPSQDTP